MVKMIGNNEFFETLRGAKTAGTRRGYSVGAKILDTSEGYCLLESNEGADNTSYKYLHNAPVVAYLHNPIYTDNVAWVNEEN